MTGIDMAKVYGFNEAGYNRVKEATRRVLGAATGGTHRRRQPPVLSGSGGMRMVGFQIVSADNCGTCTALATVAVNFGTTPDLDSYGQFTVYDIAGCALNEPVDALEGRIGFAAYGTREITGACPGLPESGWWIISLCPLEDGCP